MRQKKRKRVVKAAAIKNPTKQGKRGSVKVGYKKPPKNRQFGQPEGNKRHNGAWKKEDTARYKLEQMMKLTTAELKGLLKDDQSPAFEKRLALCVLTGEWKELEGMIDQVYGKPKNPVDVSSGGKQISVALVEFVDGVGDKK